MIFDIKNISKYKENHQLEAKKAQKGLPNSFWETYSSFANSDGGFIILGAEENDKHNLVINGVEDSHQIISDIWNTVNNPQKVSVTKTFPYHLPWKTGCQESTTHHRIWP